MRKVLATFALGVGCCAICHESKVQGLLSNHPEGEVEMTEAAEQFDVIVVGGGPAGACTAGLLALKGRKVLLLEREKFPRYHIGESLITGVWRTLDRLNVRERLDEMGFVRKYGANVLWGKEKEYWGFAFRETGPYEYVYQVRRAEFDTILLNRARELGVQVIEDTTAKEPILLGDRVVGVKYQLRGQDHPVETRAAVTVDASGQQRWLGRHFDLVDWHEDLRNIAVWGYYQGCLRYEGERAGHTLIECLDGGWLWFIPLGYDSTSIGYVTPVSLYNDSELSLPGLFESKLQESTEVAQLMEGATRVSAYRSARDWSYTCKRFHGEGWVLVGDAAVFIDPLLSTGVTLAVRGARIVADAIDQVLDDAAREDEAFAVYEANTRTFLNVILEFVRFFYDQTKTRTDYYGEAQALIDPDEAEPPDFDFVKLVSGLAEDEEFDLTKTPLQAT